MRTFFRLLGRVVVGCVVLVLLAYLGYGVHAMLDARQHRQEAAREAREGLPEAERAALAAAGQLRERLGLATPTHTWTELACAVNTHEGGWMVLDYTNECTLTRRELHPTQDPGTGTCEHVLALDTGGWPQPSARRGPAGACLPQQPRPDASVRLLSGERPQDPAGTWLVVTAAAQVSDTVVGCHRWSVIFCDRPLGLPVMPED